MIIRPVRLADAAAIAAIYAPYVTDTVITFELHTPDEAEMRARISAVTAAHPWLVAEEDGRVVGYAYGAPYRARAAYRWVAEVGIYLAMETRGRGLGSRLYTALLEALTGAGYVAAMGVMTEPNAPSTLLHERLGFRNVGTQPAIGYKHGRWYDVTFWQRDLAPRRDEPTEPGLANLQ